MRRMFACVLFMVYLCFAAVSAWQLPCNEASDWARIQKIDGHDTNSSIKEKGDSSSHFEVINFHKIHKHLAASRTVKVPGVKFSCLSSLVNISATFLDYRKMASNAVIIPANSYADIFIKNRVLRI